MLKMELEEFVEEVKAEMLGYEEISDEHIKTWENKFREWLKDNKTKKNRIKYKTNSIFIELKDETDLFKIVDKYLAAIVNDEIEKYWSDWML